MLSLYRLPGNLPNEKIIKICRRDLFVLFKRVLFVAFLAFVPAALFYILSFVFTQFIFQDSIAYPLFVIFISAYYLFVWLLLFFLFVDYYLDAWIITSERIIDIEQNGFFARTISEEMLYRIQDVTSEVDGVFPTIFRYGDVHIQTAGTEERFFFHQVPEPEEVRDTIIKLVEKSKLFHKDDK